MVGDNLAYVFLNNGFLESNNKDIGRYSHDTLPDYYATTFRFNNPKFKNSYFILQNEEIERSKDKFDKCVQFVSVEDELANTDEFKEVSDVLKQEWPRYLNDPFWYNTFIRIVLLAIFQMKTNQPNLIHIEADNLIFGTEFRGIFDTYESGEFGFPNERASASAPAFMFLKDDVSGANLLDMILTLLKKGESAISPYAGWLHSWVTDMAFLDIISRSGMNYKMLPCSPIGYYSQNVESIGYVFDPTSYGMYLGGTNNGHPKGFIDPNHYVGQLLNEGRIKIEFNGKPYVTSKGLTTPIFNLHVHNKEAIPNFI
tara:strand:+ start:4714 stop:5652 length:939 start_codon:yes stop_codon:yes gene_type:complete